MELSKQIALRHITSIIARALLSLISGIAIFAVQVIYSPIPSHGFDIITSSWFIFGTAWYFRKAKEKAEQVDIPIIRFSIVSYSMLFIGLVLKVGGYFILISEGNLILSGGGLPLIISIIIDLITFIALSQNGVLPTSQIALWLVVFFISILSGVGLMIYSTMIDISPMIVEMSGIFVGALAAISLGEVLKATSSRRTSIELVDILSEELQRIHDELQLKDTKPISVPVWTAAVSNGRILEVPRKKRDGIAKAYSDVLLFIEHRLPEFRELAISSIKAILDDISPDEHPSFHSLTKLFTQLTPEERKEEISS